MSTGLVGKNVIVKWKSDDFEKRLENFKVLEDCGDSCKVIHHDLLSIAEKENFILNVHRDNLFLQPEEDGYIEADNAKEACVKKFREVYVDEEKLKIFSKTNKAIPEWKPTKNLIPYPDITKVYLDIETLGLDPQKHRIIYIGLKLKNYPDFKDNNLKVFTDENGVENKYILITHKDEKKILTEFVKVIRKLKPELLAGYNYFDFDINFIIKRCEILGVKHDFKVKDYIVTVKTAQLFGEPVRYNAVYLYYETSLVDVFHQVLSYDNVRRTLTSHTLKQAVLQLKLRKEQRLELSYQDIVKFWQNGNIELIAEYLRYDLDDTELLADFLLPSIYYQQLFVPDMNMQRLATTGNGTKWQKVLESLYPEIGKGVLEADFKDDFAGGYTEGIAGLHRRVSKVDVASLYPSIMLKYGITSRKDPYNRMLGVLQYLLRERLILKREAERASKGDPTADKNAKQKEGALKVIINSAFGVLGTDGVAFNDIEAAALVTAYGRRIAKLMKKIIEREGGRIVEVDTDGIIFSTLESNNYQIYKTTRDSLPVGINLEYEWAAEAAYIPPSDSKTAKNGGVGARKNYLIFYSNGDVKATGKFRKRDFSQLEKEFQINYLKKYLKSPDEAEEYYFSQLALIQSKDYPASQLSVTRKIRRGEIELLKLKIGNTGDVVTFYETHDGKKGIEGQYSIKHYQNVLKKLRSSLLKVIDPELLSNAKESPEFIDNNTVQLSLFSMLN